MSKHVRDLRVLSIPAEHPYTQAIRPAGVEYLPDPDIDGHWWPHPALDADFWRTPPEADILHIHFGFEHRSPDQIEELVAALPIPLVVTAHDLDNPHLSDQAAQADHHRRLRTLVQAAHSVVTLTDGAAHRLRIDFGVRGVITLPHPAIVRTQMADAVQREPVVGVFLKSLRSNVVSDPQFYLDIASQVPLRVFVHDFDETRALREALEGRVDLVVHDPLDDASLHRAVATLSVCLLPYVRGTHSGWLEMCRDLGTSVAVPDSGCYIGQADRVDAVDSYRVADSRSAATTARRLLERGTMPYAGDRARQLEHVRQAHAEIYRRAVAERGNR